MKTRNKVFLFVILLITIVLSVDYYFKNNNFQDKEDNLLNISELSPEFMDTYFEEYSKIESEDEKENMLIVTSLNEISNDYGAINIIKAPNNQYLLQYESKEAKDIALDKFKVDNTIISVDKNEMVTFSETEYNSWGIEKMALDNAISIANENNLPEVKVAIIDTGCDVDLVNKYYPDKIIETYDVLNKTTESMSDTYGHGTHIAGTIAEGTPSNVKIVPIKVSIGEHQYISDIVAAIYYVVYNKKADIMNMSFGSYSSTNSLYSAIESANQQNIITVAAAGNDNKSSEFFPAAFDNTISIASVDSQLIKSDFSNYGSMIDFVAPGTNIKSTLSSAMELSKGTDGDDDFEIISGTSMATPHAVNAVSILKSYNKNLTKDNVVELLKDYAVKDLGTIGKDEHYGNGFIYFDSESFCTNPQEDDCEEFGVFKSSSKISISKFEVEYILRTSYNYGTVNNFNPLKIKVTYSNGAVVTEALGNLSGVEIIGYDPYATEEQTITIKWQGLQTNFEFTNPEDWNSGWKYEVIDDSTAKLTGFTNFNLGNYETKKLYIPDAIDGYDIVEIADKGNSQSIFVAIGSSSFEEIILPSTLTKISGYHTFEGFTSVKKITSLAGMLTITADNVFSNDTSLTQITSPLYIEGKNTFKNNISLQNITLSDTMTEIPQGTFDGCTSLTDFAFPSSLKTIGDSAFQNTGLINIVIPDGVETIGAYAFRQYDKSTIKKVTLSSNLKTIGEQAFYGALITEINLPDSLKSIENSAFGNETNLKSIHIPKNVTSLGTDIFILSSNLETMTVDSENTVYDSRNNSNAIIETATNTLLYGSSKTIIPDGIQKIGKNSLAYINIEKLTIPESVTEIGDYAFFLTPLEKLYIPSSVDTIGEKAFVGKDGKYITIWTNTNSYAKTYAVNNKIPYEATNLSCIKTSLSNYNFYAFDKVEAEIYAYFDRGEKSADSYNEWKKISGREETIDPNNVEIIYQNNRDSFRYDDTSFAVKGTTQYGEQFEKTFNVTISKITPTYEIPQNLTADLGQKLSDITLPDGFEWVNPNTVIEETGNAIFKANYIPTDTTNYETVENIDITVFIKVPKTIIIPNIVLSDKTYDGTNTLEKSNITISNLKASEYTIVSATLSSSDVGNKTATITLRLTDDKYENYSFEGGMQEKEFKALIKIVPKKIPKPTKSDVNYVYNGKEITFDIINYNENYMSVLNNKGTNAGEYTIVISLKNNNYAWDDNTTNDISLIYNIAKANLNVKDSSSDVTVTYDGKPHSIKVNFDYKDGTVIRYMDENGKYTLENVPEYTNVGTYVTKYKLYLDDNYTEYLGEKTLTITGNTVTNNSTDYEVIYDGNEHSININIEPSNYTIKYSINNTNYDLTKLPTFKEVGEYTINYKISADGYEDLEASNKVKIYGVKQFDSSIKLNNDKLIIQNNSFYSLSNKVTTYSKSSEYKHYNKNNVLITSDTLKTGDIMKVILNGTTTYEYHIAYLGDTSGDGKINYLDYVNVYNHIQKVKHPETSKKLLVDEYLLAADMSGDNKISYLDYVKIYNKIKELKGGK